MSQSLSCVLLHVVFSTRERTPWLDDALRPDVHAFLAGAVRTCECEAYRVGGVADHVHLAIRLSRTLSIANLVQQVKSASSKWIKEQDMDLSQFAWQKGYGAFSVGMSQKEALVTYIDQQEEHHKFQSFQDEYRKFLKKYGIDFDERYVWD